MQPTLASLLTDLQAIRLETAGRLAKVDAAIAAAEALDWLGEPPGWYREAAASVASAALAEVQTPATPNVDEERRAGVLDLLKAAGPLSTASLAASLGQDRTVVKQALQRMKRAGLLQSVGTGRATRWQRADAPPAAIPPPAVKPALANVVEVVGHGGAAAAVAPGGAVLRLGTLLHGHDVPPPATAVSAACEEAGRLARRRGHDLGSWKDSGPGSVPGLIARCRTCNTYIRIRPGDHSKPEGPGTRHDCPSLEAK